MLTYSNKSFSHILVIRLSSLGDVLLTTPVLRVLKEHFNEAKIDFLAADPFHKILENNPKINKIYVYNKSETLKEISYWKKNIADTLPFKKYDLIIDLQNNFRSRYFSFGLSKNVLRYNKHRLEKLLLVNFKIKPKIVTPIPERYISTLEPLGIYPDNIGLELYLDKPEKNNKLILFAPGAKHFTKRWLPEYFAELADLLSKDGYKIALIGGNDDYELCKFISKMANSEIDNFAGVYSVKQSAEFISSSVLLVSNDSAAMHFAAAVNTPVLAIFGSTTQELGFSPYNSEHLIVETELSCRPCTHIGRADCPKKHFNCMKQISPLSVYYSALKLIG